MLTARVDAPVRSARRARVAAVPAALASYLIATHAGAPVARLTAETEAVAVADLIDWTHDHPGTFALYLMPECGAPVPVGTAHDGVGYLPELPPLTAEQRAHWQRQSAIRRSVA